MKTDFYTKFILTMIAIGLFANAGSNFISEARAEFRAAADGGKFVRVCGKVAMGIPSDPDLKPYGKATGADCVEVKNGALLVKVVR